ncbi:hypothetical protein AJ79_08558 [Helicocarpus griseus UAMH5409]|uniref:Uncharacterized protein n=1 Tax=Helicocarpus griseus UAMH5409 TaxID=1447875 RepID=A0A2B7WRU7_9EURO|nr:hypothetical protein AJ79_08558 [Helicocarpus griseus UAMH5409]
MNFDDLACRKHETVFILWKRSLNEIGPEQLARKLALLHCKRTAVEVKSLSNGAYNECFRVKFTSGPDVVVRFSVLGRSFLRKEKVTDELAIMSYIATQSTTANSYSHSQGVWCRGVRSKLLTEHIQAPVTDKKQTVVLNMGLDMFSPILCKAYREMARVLLALSEYKFPYIGVVGKDTPEAPWSITKRAVTFNMNELVRIANYPPQDFHKGPFPTTSEYFIMLAEHHLHHLKMQRNNAVLDEDDCRKKYIARCLLRKIAQESHSPHDKGPFPLFCDDFRPSNVIVDNDLNIQSVIDWEYCYAAPVEFAHCSPWWLILSPPEEWVYGLDDFLANFLPLFLEILSQCEQELLDTHLPVSNPEKPLSSRIRESMENGLFWFCLAARTSFGFYEIYWRFIDENYFGKFHSLDERLMLLSDGEQENLEPFVQLKMQQAKENTLDRHQTGDQLVYS